MRVSGGGTDSLNGLEYFGLITLASRGLRVLSMRFFWHACGVCAFYGFVSVIWSCDPSFIAYPHGLPIVRYPFWFFRHVWYLVLCFSCSIYADGSSTGSCSCLVQCCRVGGFFPKSAVCSDRILTCRIKSICSPAKGGTGCYRFNYQPGS